MITITFFRKKLIQKKNAQLKEIKKALHSSSTIWIDILSPSDKEMETLQKIFRLHELICEDLTSNTVRPKIETLKNYSFLVLYDIPSQNHAAPVQVNYLIGKNFVVSLHKKKIGSYNAFEKDPKMLAELLRKKPEFLLHKLVDLKVDNYFTVLNDLEQKLDKLQIAILKDPSPHSLQQLFRIKNCISNIRRVAMPQRDTIALLTKQHIPFFSEEVAIYFRDIYDNMIHISDKIDMNRDIISSVLELHLSVTSNKMNEVMKLLTLIATIMLPLGVIAGIYGMNFKYIPGLEWKYGYYTILVIMMILGICMWLLFKRKRWV